MEEGSPQNQNKTKIHLNEKEETEPEKHKGHQLLTCFYWDMNIEMNITMLPIPPMLCKHVLVGYVSEAEHVCISP